MNEFNLIKELNAQGNLNARRKFKEVHRYLYRHLSAREKEMLKLADFIANESHEWWVLPGMVTALGILRDYWPRWFGGKANTQAKYNPDIYWIPWSFFMEDDFIRGVKYDLLANLFNKAAQDALWEELYKADKVTDETTYFDFTAEEPLLWNKVAFQSRGVKFCNEPDSFRNPKYWALGDFSINAVAKGAVIPLDGGGHRICVSNAYLFIHDTFNFETPAFPGFWDTKNQEFPSLSLQMLALSNGDFRDFRKKHGYGRNFTVLSPFYELPDFEGLCWEVK